MSDSSMFGPSGAPVSCHQRQGYPVRIQMTSSKPDARSEVTSCRKSCIVSFLVNPACCFPLVTFIFDFLFYFTLSIKVKKKYPNNITRVLTVTVISTLRYS